MQVFVLFQTDVWNTYESRVFFGVFTTYEAAEKAAKDNNLYIVNIPGEQETKAGVMIVEAELDKFEEL